MILVTTMPNSFYSSLGTYKEHEVPNELFEAIDIHAWNLTYTDNVPDDFLVALPYDLGGWHFQMAADNDHALWGDLIWHEKYDLWFGIWPYNYIRMDFIAPTGENLGTEIDASDIDTYWNEDENATKFYVRETAIQIVMYFSYNTTTYTGALDAWNSDDLIFMSAMGFDQAQTATNAWSIIGMLLFFQLPQVHPILNMIIALPIWACVVYLIYRLILLAIPFVG